MKTLVIKMFLVLFLFTSFSQAQDWIKEYPGIPLEAGLDWDWITKQNGAAGNHAALDSMKLAGIDIVRLKLANLGKMDTITTWDSSGFRALPFRSADISGNVYNWIQHYTDAKYSVWEAEGSSLGIDDAGLVQKHPSITETYNYQDATFVRRLGNIPNAIDTLTEGPYYIQDVHYYASQGDNCDTIRYKATFSLMLENNSPAPPYNPTDTICVLQVTYSKNDSPFHLDTTIIIEERIVRRNKFDNLNVIDTVSIDYDLANTVQLESPDYLPDPQNTFKADLNCPGLRDDRKYIQFKVIWKGKSNPNGMPQYLLSFDKVIVSDLRGRELVDPSSEARSNIEIQDQKLIDFETDITGWMGIDEPVSIDIFEPIRIVKEILSTKTSNKRPLRIPFMGSWSGYWDRSDNIFGAMGKSKWTWWKWNLLLSKNG